MSNHDQHCEMEKKITGLCECRSRILESRVDDLIRELGIMRISHGPECFEEMAPISDLIPESYADEDLESKVRRVLDNLKHMQEANANIHQESIRYQELYLKWKGIAIDMREKCLEAYRKSGTSQEVEDRIRAISLERKE